MFDDKAEEEEGPRAEDAAPNILAGTTHSSLTAVSREFGGSGVWASLDIVTGSWVVRRWNAGDAD